MAQLDTRYYHTPYYIAPRDLIGQEAFAVIRDAMAAKDVVGTGGAAALEGRGARLRTRPVELDVLYNDEFVVGRTGAGNASGSIEARTTKAPGGHACRSVALHRADTSTHSKPADHRNRALHCSSADLVAARFILGIHGLAGQTSRWRRRLPVERFTWRKATRPLVSTAG